MKRIGKLKLFLETFLCASLFFSTACGMVSDSQYAVIPNSSSMKRSKGFSGSIVPGQSKGKTDLEKPWTIGFT